MSKPSNLHIAPLDPGAALATSLLGNAIPRLEAKAYFDEDIAKLMGVTKRAIQMRRAAGELDALQPLWGGRGDAYCHTPGAIICFLYGDFIRLVGKTLRPPVAR